MNPRAPSTGNGSSVRGNGFRLLPAGHWTLDLTTSREGCVFVGAAESKSCVFQEIMALNAKLTVGLALLLAGSADAWAQERLRIDHEAGREIVND